MSEEGVAVVGCGWAGQRHARAFIAEGARIRWAVDPDTSRAAAVARLQPGARPAASIAEPLSDPAVTMIDVCTPHSLHEEICTLAIAAGKDVLCEKPLAPTVAAADKMAVAAENADKLLMVAENECFNAVYHRIKELLDAGVIGRPALVQATRECYPAESLQDASRWWLHKEESGGGIVLSGGIHDFAKLRMMVGEITLVYALRAPQRFHLLETEDTAVMVLGFDNGAVGTLAESFFMLDPTTATGDEVHRLRIDGAQGSMEVIGHDRIRITSLNGVREVTVAVVDTFRAEVREFLDCVQTRREPQTSARRQRRNLELVESAYESIASGQPIRV